MYFIIRDREWGNARKDVPLKGYAKYVLEHGKKGVLPPKPKEKTANPNPQSLINPKENISGEKTLSSSTESQTVKQGTIQKIGLNINKAKVDEDKTEYPEVDTFLGSVNLEKYKDTFIANGFEDLESILELEDEHFKTMSIPLGHKLKMLKRIRELKGKPEKTEEKSEAGVETNTSSLLQQKDSVHIQEEDKGNCEAGVEANAPKIPPQKTSTAAAQEEFNEEESHKEFLQAREAWLKERQKNLSVIKESVNEADLEKDKGTTVEVNPKVNLLLAVGGDAWNVNCLPEFVENGTGTSPKNDTQIKHKECCWGCCKLFIKGTGFPDSFTGKVFNLIISHI